MSTQPLNTPGSTQVPDQDRMLRLARLALIHDGIDAALDVLNLYLAMVQWQVAADSLATYLDGQAEVGQGVTPSITDEAEVTA